jgi:hypothetical protein
MPEIIHRTSLTLLQRGHKYKAGFCFSQIKQMIKEDILFNLSMGLQTKRKEICGKNTVDELREDKC